MTGPASKGWQVAVALLLTSDDAVLLVRRAGDDVWSIPTAVLDPSQLPEERVRALAQAELGLEVPWVDLAWAQVRNEPEPTLVLVYTSEAPDYPRPAAHIAEARFFQVEHLPPLSPADRDALYRAITGG